MVDDDYSAGRGGNLFPFSRLFLRLHYVPKLVIIIYSVILLPQDCGLGICQIRMEYRLSQVLSQGSG